MIAPARLLMRHHESFFSEVVGPMVGDTRAIEIPLTMTIET